MHTNLPAHNSSTPGSVLRARWSRWRLVVFSMLFAVAGFTLATTNAGSQFARARAAWNARPFSAYRASIVHRYQPGAILTMQQECGMIVEVQPGVAPLLITGDCAAPLSIEAILARFEPYAHASLAARDCALSDCTCALSVLTVERDARTGYPRRLARDWRDATVGAWPVWRLLLPAPASLRAVLRGYAERWNPCHPRTGNSSFHASPIYREEFKIISVEPLDTPAMLALPHRCVYAPAKICS